MRSRTTRNIPYIDFLKTVMSQMKQVKWELCFCLSHTPVSASVLLSHTQSCVLSARPRRTAHIWPAGPCSSKRPEARCASRTHWSLRSSGPAWTSSPSVCSWHHASPCPRGSCEEVLVGFLEKLSTDLSNLTTFFRLQGDARMSRGRVEKKAGITKFRFCFCVFGLSVKSRWVGETCFRCLPVAAGQ